MKAKQAETRSLAPQPQPAAELGREQIELIKQTVAKGASDLELQLFLAQCRRSGLDPLAKQLYFVKRWDARERREVMTTQTSIDGLRLIADRTGRYEGQEGPFWCGPDGIWHDVWAPDEPPVAARIGVLKAGCRSPFWGVARFTEYCQVDRDGNPSAMWRKMPATMIAKCAEANALRKAFPAEMSGLYSSEEMMQAGEAPPAGPPAAAADSRPPQPSETNPAAPARPWRNFKGMVDAFAELRGRLAPDYEHVYYATLKEFNVKHSNQFKDGDQAAACYQRLLQQALEVEAATAEAESMPPEDFDAPEASL
jgi:phage recombination protein Bet